MNQSAEQIIETVRALPLSEQEKFFDLAEKEKRKVLSEKRAKDIQSQKKSDRFRHSMQWIHENLAKYDGQWVALDGDVLLAHGTDGKKVYAEAQAKGVETPLMHRISIKELQPFGGW